MVGAKWRQLALMSGGVLSTLLILRPCGTCGKKRKRMLERLRGTLQRMTHLGQGRYYVYRLHYPDDAHTFGHLAGGVFYVGKGTRDRILAHERETRAILKRGRVMLLKHKHKVILGIWDAGYDVVQEVIFRTDDEEEAYRVESAEIDRIGLAHLTNATYGRRPRRGSRRAA